MMTARNPVEVAIIGGGPAGMSAAAWCGDLGLDTLLLERHGHLGGQLHLIHNPITNYLGLDARDGRELLSMFERSIEKFPFRRLANREVVSLDPIEKTIHLDDASEIRFEALIVATGVRRRRLNVPGETEFVGKGIIDSGARDKETLRGRRVIIVGGGDAAIENALILSEWAESVTVVHRNSNFKARPEFLGRLRESDKISVETDTVVEEILGDSRVTGVVVSNSSDGGPHTKPADAVLIRIGVEPNSDICRGILEMDARGYIRTDSSGETNVSGIFAVGDVANPLAPTISTAAGTGATAAKTIYYSLRGQRGYNTPIQ